jgi:hypothetical protein
MKTTETKEQKTIFEETYRRLRLERVNSDPTPWLLDDDDDDDGDDDDNNDI